MPKIIIATQIERLDKQLESSEQLINAGYEVVLPGYGDIVETAITGIDDSEKKSLTPPLVVISRTLASSREALLDIIYQLRAEGFRVLLLPGNKGSEEAEYVTKKAFQLGVYDFVYDPLSADKVIHCILNPATLAEAGVNPDDENAREFAEEPLSDAEISEPQKERRPRGLNRFKMPHFTMPNLPRMPFKKDNVNKDIKYIPHHVVAVWSPVGGLVKNLTAFNLAVTAVEQKFDVALINFNLTGPLLDKWFKIPNTSLDKVKDAHGAGIMTFGSDLKPDLVEKMLVEHGWGIRYLPAGNKLGNIGTPNISLQTLEQIIQMVFRRETNGRPAITIIDTDSSFELPTAFSALKNASILVIPTQTKQEDELVNDQLAELGRLKLKPKIYKIAWGDDIPYNPELIETSSKQKKPYCSYFDENPFEFILDQVLT